MGAPVNTLAMVPTLSNDVALLPAPFTKLRLTRCTRTTVMACARGGISSSAYRSTRGPVVLVDGLKTNDSSPSSNRAHCQFCAQPAAMFCGWASPGPFGPIGTQLGPLVGN